jgi:hypothetical protein
MYDHDIPGKIIAALAIAHAKKIHMIDGVAGANMVVSAVAPYHINIHESIAIPVDILRCLISHAIKIIDAIISHKKKANT